MLEIGVLIAVLLTLMVFTFPLIGDGPLFRISEALFIGLQLGYSLLLALQTIMNRSVTPMLAGNYSYIIPVILGLLLYARFNTKTYFISRWPLALIFGVGTGLAIKGVVEAQIVSQIRATMLPLLAPTIMGTITNWVMIIGTITSLAYFLLTAEYSKYFGKAPKLGRYFLMVTFGTIFSNWVLTYFTWLLDRFDFLLTSLGII